jgi:hypothetical protein
MDHYTGLHFGLVACPKLDTDLFTRVRTEAIFSLVLYTNLKIVVVVVFVVAMVYAAIPMLFVNEVF